MKKSFEKVLLSFYFIRQMAEAHEKLKKTIAAVKKKIKQNNNRLCFLFFISSLIL
jgi:uncharacterized protein YeeX (DUF496 family)